MRPFRSLWLVLALLCGGGGGGGGDGGGSLTGAWLLSPTVGGIAGDTIHLTIEQNDNVLVANVSCRSTFPPGAGRWGGGIFSLVFTFGTGATLSLEGTAVGGNFAGNMISPEGAGTFLLQRTVDDPTFCAHACDPLSVIRFVDQDFTQLEKIQEISRFRSSAGHDFSDDCETCRSMKHYFAPFPAYLANNTVEVRCPVDGQVVAVTAETHGASPSGLNKQVRIRSTLHPEYTFVFFHVDLAPPNVTPGVMISKGTLLGHARLYYDDLAETAHDFDIAVRIHTPYTDRYVSWFDVITDGVFAAYAARGVPDRTTMIHTRAARDAQPLTCSGETFTWADPLPVWFVLGPP